jgi:hypothetical protein
MANISLQVGKLLQKEMPLKTYPAIGNEMSGSSSHGQRPTSLQLVLAKKTRIKIYLVCISMYRLAVEFFVYS